MLNVLKSIQVFNKITKTKWDNTKTELNCVYFTPCENGTKWYFTNTKKVAYGELDITISKPLLIPIKELSKVKKAESFEFLEDGLKIDGKKIKAIDGYYPDIERVINPSNTTEYTIKANFKELGTLLEALKYEVTISVENGELKFHQKSSWHFDAEFEYFLPCDGDLPFKVRSGYGIYSLMAKEDLKEVKIIYHKVTYKDKEEEVKYISFDTSFCKFFCMSYKI